MKNIRENVAVIVDSTEDKIQNLIHYIRGQQVMIDSDLAMLYNVETKRLNESVKRNAKRFPESFCFQLTEDEYADLRSQIATSNTETENASSKGGRRISQNREYLVDGDENDIATEIMQVDIKT